MRRKQSTNIGSIQSLRGIAAAMVTIFHIVYFTEVFGLQEAHVEPLKAGVDIFFVISGFIMWVTTASKPDASAISFYRDRLIRIVPLYWTMTLIAFVLVAAATPHLLASLMFLPFSNGAGLSPVLLPGWTLNYEMFFYLLFGIAIWLSRRSLVLRALLILGVLGILALVGRLTGLEGWSAFYTNTIIVEFGFGIAIGAAYLSGRVRQHPAWALLTMLGFALLALSFTRNMGPQIIAWGVPAAMIVAGAVFGIRARLRSLETLGDWSYSLYLTHWIVLLATFPVVDLLEVRIPAWLIAAALLALCIVASGLIYRFFEVPVTRWLKGLSHGTERGQEAGSASGPLPVGANSQD